MPVTIKYRLTVKKAKAIQDKNKERSSRNSRYRRYRQRVFPQRKNHFGCNCFVEKRLVHQRNNDSEIRKCNRSIAHYHKLLEDMNLFRTDDSEL